MSLAPRHFAPAESRFQFNQTETYSVDADVFADILHDFVRPVRNNFTLSLTAHVRSPSPTELDAVCDRRLRVHAATGRVRRCVQLFHPQPEEGHSRQECALLCSVWR